MFIDDVNFIVKKSKYAERHFSKDFLKKSKPKNWKKTEEAFFDTLERSFFYQQRKLIRNINFKDNCGIFKLYFAIAGEKQSPKDSGNRLIFFLDNEKELIEILMVYGKRHCPNGQHETQWIKEQVKNNFPQYKKYCV